MQGLAMKLTFARMLLIPLFVFFYYCHPHAWGQWIALIIYAVACITDYLDGFLARRYKDVSPFGAFLDPVADKLMVAAVLLVLLQKHPTWWLLIGSMVIIGREIWISALREWMASMQMRDAVAVSKVGKWKTTFQMLALGFLIFEAPFRGLPIWGIGQALFAIAVILTIYSMTKYNMDAYHALQKQ